MVLNHLLNGMILQAPLPDPNRIPGRDPRSENLVQVNIELYAGQKENPENPAALKKKEHMTSYFDFKRTSPRIFWRSQQGKFKINPSQKE